MLVRTPLFRVGRFRALVTWLVAFRARVVPTLEGFRAADDFRETAFRLAGFRDDVFRTFDAECFFTDLRPVRLLLLRVLGISRVSCDGCLRPRPAGGSADATGTLPVR